MVQVVQTQSFGAKKNCSSKHLDQTSTGPGSEQIRRLNSLLFLPPVHILANNDNVHAGLPLVFNFCQKLLKFGTVFKWENEKRDNKQCLLDTPSRVTVNNKRLISKCKKSEKKMHIYKSHGIIKNYKEKLL